VPRKIRGPLAGFGRACMSQAEHCAQPTRPAVVVPDLWCTPHALWRRSGFERERCSAHSPVAIGVGRSVMKKDYYLMTSPTMNQTRVAKATLYASATRKSRPHLVEFPWRRNGGNPFCCVSHSNRNIVVSWPRELGARSGGLGSADAPYRDLQDVRAEAALTVN
jgi:hypothetical protein